MAVEITFQSATMHLPVSPVDIPPSPEQPRIRQVVQLGVVHNVPDAAVEGLAERGVVPLVVQRVELLRRHPADLQRRVDVEVLVEGGNAAADLAGGAVELGGLAVLVFHHVGRAAEVHHKADFLSVKMGESFS